MITVDVDVVYYDADRGFSLENFAVTGEFDPAAVVRALEAAADRFMLQNEQGVIHPELPSVQTVGASSPPSCFSDAEPGDEGLLAYVDCQGAIKDSVAVDTRKILSKSSRTLSLMLGRRSSVRGGVGTEPEAV